MKHNKCIEKERIIQHFIKYSFIQKEIMYE